MNTAIILSGGTGSRLGGGTPKQYIEVLGKPIIKYCLDVFDNNELIDDIVVVVAEEWKTYVQSALQDVSKFKCFANAGASRQESVLNGLMASDPRTDIVIIHDAARPNVTEEIISNCINAIDEYDGVMPVLPLKDTVYFSENGSAVTDLLDREKLFAGQAPECFMYKKYLSIHKEMNREDLSKIKGSSEIAFRGGLKIKMIQGDEHNYKITTIADLEKFVSEAK